MKNKNLTVVVRVGLAAALLLLTACSSLQNMWRSQDFTLLSSSSDKQPRIAQQQWRVQQGGSNYAVDVIVERSANQWRWIMLSSLGQRLATVESTGGQVKIERLQSHPANKHLPELLQAWQFSYWPLVDLQAADARWLFSEADGRREARFSGILRATVEYQTDSQIEHQDTANQVNPWQGSLNYNAGDLHLFIQSQPLN